MMPTRSDVGLVQNSCANNVRFLKYPCHQDHQRQERLLHHHTRVEKPDTVWVVFPFLY